MARYAITITLSAFLLFQVQPLIARFILPWFGGTPAVWTTCMLFFQIVLLAGYTYAHLIDRFLPPKRQAILHIALLLITLVCLPIIPDTYWKPSGEESPTLRILVLLAATIGLPYLLLSTTGPLMQAWFRRTHPGRSPYRLFALSNTGSLVALVTYPFLFEPYLPLGRQAYLWSIGFALFVALGCVCAWLARQSKDESRSEESPTSSKSLATTDSKDSAAGATSAGDGKPGSYDIFLWLVLAMFPSVLLLATTSQLSQEVAVVPFLWVLPLSLYLITFIICFDSPRWYVRPIFAPLSIVFNILAALSLAKGVQLEVWVQMISLTGALFINCMCCHGELARNKPNPEYLTFFYLFVSLGGALGGVFVVLVAPFVFTSYIEMHIGLGACFAFSVISYLRHKDWFLTTAFPAWVTSPAGGAAVGGMVVLLIVVAQDQEQGVIEKQRGFFGTLTVRATYDSDDRVVYRLRNGRIKHGMQMMRSDLLLARTSYYAEQSGIGQAILYQHRTKGPNEPVHLGVVGLGTGTLAAYGRPGDRIRFYEINPDVIDVATRRFKYVTENPAQTELILGDARVQMEQEAERGELQMFDVLAVDAFSSDAIPMHLLTRECFEVYLQHLKPDGVLAIHISNRYLDLGPVVYQLGFENGFDHPLFVDYEPTAYPPADDLTYQLAGISTYEIELLYGYYNPLFEDWYPNLSNPRYSPYYDDSSEWVLLSRNEDFINDRLIQQHSEAIDDSVRGVVWTDDYGSIWQVMREFDMDDLFELFSFD